VKTDRRRFFPFWVPLLFGLMTLINVLTKPSVATYHKPDVIMLVMSGFLLGTALGGFIAFRQARERSS